MSQISEEREIKGRTPHRGTVYYDGCCSLCTDLVRRFRGSLARAGFATVPLQDARAAADLGVEPGDLLDEMRVRTVDGAVHGGADAVLLLARHLPWTLPLRIVAQLPGGTALLRRGYRFVASRRRSCSLDGIHGGPPHDH